MATLAFDQDFAQKEIVPLSKEAPHKMIFCDLMNG